MNRLGLAAAAILAAAYGSLVACPAVAAEREVAAFGARCDGGTDDTADSGPAISADTKHVKNFGAKGDGSTDDTDALRDAFNAVKNGGTLTFEAGATYLISDRIAFDNASCYTIEGQGATIKIKNGTSKDNGPFLDLKAHSDFTWLNLLVDGNRENRSCPGFISGDQKYRYHNIALTASENFTFQNVESRNSCMDGFYVHASEKADPSTYSRNGKFIDVVAHNNSRQGLSIINARNLEIIGGSYSFTRGDWPMAGIDIEPNRGSAEPGVENVTIQKAEFIGNEGQGIMLSGKAHPRNIVIKDNYFKDNRVAAINVNTAPTTIERNLIEDHTQWTKFPRHDGKLVPNVYLTALPVIRDHGRDVVIRNNSFINIRSYGSGGVVYIRDFDDRSTGRGEVSGNCFEDVELPAIRNDREEMVSESNNRMNPAGGCPDPRRR